jgi:hypothetical protein
MAQDRINEKNKQATELKDIQITKAFFDALNKSLEDKSAARPNTVFKRFAAYATVIVTTNAKTTPALKAGQQTILSFLPKTKKFESKEETASNIIQFLLELCHFIDLLPETKTDSQRARIYSWCSPFIKAELNHLKDSRPSEELQIALRQLFTDENQKKTHTLLGYSLLFEDIELFDQLIQAGATDSIVSCNNNQEINLVQFLENLVDKTTDPERRIELIHMLRVSSHEKYRTISKHIQIKKEKKVADTKEETEEEKEVPGKTILERFNQFNKELSRATRLEINTAIFKEKTKDTPRDIVSFLLVLCAELDSDNIESEIDPDADRIFSYANFILDELKSLQEKYNKNEVTKALNMSQRLNLLAYSIMLFQDINLFEQLVTMGASLEQVGDIACETDGVLTKQANVIEFLWAHGTQDFLESLMESDVYKTHIESNKSLPHLYEANPKKKIIPLARALRYNNEAFVQFYCDFHSTFHGNFIFSEEKEIEIDAAYKKQFLFPDESAGYALSHLINKTNFCLYKLTHNTIIIDKIIECCMSMLDQNDTRFLKTTLSHLLQRPPELFAFLKGNLETKDTPVENTTIASDIYFKKVAKWVATSLDEKAVSFISSQLRARDPEDNKEMNATFFRHLFETLAIIETLSTSKKLSTREKDALQELSASLKTVLYALKDEDKDNIMTILDDGYYTSIPALIPFFIEFSVDVKKIMNHARQKNVDLNNIKKLINDPELPEEATLILTNYAMAYKKTDQVARLIDSCLPLQPDSKEETSEKNKKSNPSKKQKKKNKSKKQKNRFKEQEKTSKNNTASATQDAASTLDEVERDTRHVVMNTDPVARPVVNVEDVGRLASPRELENPPKKQNKKPKKQHKKPKNKKQPTPNESKQASQAFFSPTSDHSSSGSLPTTTIGSPAGSPERSPAASTTDSSRRSFSSPIGGSSSGSLPTTDSLGSSPSINEEKEQQNDNDFVKSVLDIQSTILAFRKASESFSDNLHIQQFQSFLDTLHNECEEKFLAPNGLMQSQQLSQSIRAENVDDLLTQWNNQVLTWHRKFETQFQNEGIQPSHLRVKNKLGEEISALAAYEQGKKWTETSYFSEDYKHPNDAELIEKIKALFNGIGFRGQIFLLGSHLASRTATSDRDFIILPKATEKDKPFDVYRFIECIASYLRCDPSLITCTLVENPPEVKDKKNQYKNFSISVRLNNNQDIKVDISVCQTDPTENTHYVSVANMLQDINTGRMYCPETSYADKEEEIVRLTNKMLVTHHDNVKAWGFILRMVSKFIRLDYSVDKDIVQFFADAQKSTAANLFMHSYLQEVFKKPSFNYGGFHQFFTTNKLFDTAFSIIDQKHQYNISVNYSQHLQKYWEDFDVFAEEKHSISKASQYVALLYFDMAYKNQTNNKLINEQMKKFFIPEEKEKASLSAGKLRFLKREYDNTCQLLAELVNQVNDPSPQNKSGIRLFDRSTRPPETVTMEQDNPVSACARHLITQFKLDSYCSLSSQATHSQRRTDTAYRKNQR